jgi:hypothetical protein
MNYVAVSTGTHGLLVWNEGSANTTAFYIKECTTTYLPLVVKD